MKHSSVSFLFLSAIRLLPLFVLLLRTAGVKAKSSKNSCHPGSIKRTPAKECSSLVLPKGLCSSCGLGNFNNNGVFTDCTRLMGLEDNKRRTNGKCVRSLEEYVKMNPCDNVRADALDDYHKKGRGTSRAEKERAREKLDFFLYAVCEQACDCIPQNGADRNNPKVDVNRQNCPVHAAIDICDVAPNIRLIRLEGTKNDASSLPKVCPILDRDSKPPVDKSVRYFLKRAVEAAELTKNLKFWQQCFDLESKQNRIKPKKNSEPKPARAPTNSPTRPKPVPPPGDKPNPGGSGTFSLKGCKNKRLCGMCEGDCTHDSDCAGELVCFQKDGPGKVPGCKGHSNNKVDFCTTQEAINESSKKKPTRAPKPVVDEKKGGKTMGKKGIRPGRPTATSPLSRCKNKRACGMCEGDCTYDRDCAGDLVCFQKDGPGHVPGCKGYSNNKIDYCTTQQAIDYISRKPTPKGLDGKKRAKKGKKGGKKKRKGNLKKKTAKRN